MSLTDDIIKAFDEAQYHPRNLKVVAVQRELKNSQIFSAAVLALDIIELEAGKVTNDPIRESKLRQAFYSLRDALEEFK